VNWKAMVEGDYARPVDGRRMKCFVSSRLVWIYESCFFEGGC
jgi:hypothetical protein